MDVCMCVCVIDRRTSRSALRRSVSTLTLVMLLSPSTPMSIFLRCTLRCVPSICICVPVIGCALGCAYAYACVFTRFMVQMPCVREYSKGCTQTFRMFCVRACVRGHAYFFCIRFYSILEKSKIIIDFCHHVVTCFGPIPLPPPWTHIADI